MAGTLQAGQADKMEQQTREDTPEALRGQSAYTPEEARDNIPPGTRVRVIVNPASGQKAGITTNAAGTADVRRVLEENNIEAEVIESEHAGHATELAAEAVREKYDLVVACGGDGTVSEVAAALIGKKKTALGILPLGSANNVARMMHVPFDLGEAAKVLRLGEKRDVDVGRCNGHYFLETAGVGLDAALFPILNRLDHGEYIRLFEAARTLFRFRPHRLTLILDKKIVRVRALMVLVANGPYWGFSIPLAPDAKVDDHMFDVVVFRNFSKTDFIRHIIAMLLRRGQLENPQSPGKHWRLTHHPKVQTYLAKRVRIIARGRRLPVHSDAQPRGCTPVSIEILPGVLRVITGPGEHATIPPSEGTPKGDPPKHRLGEDA